MNDQKISVPVAKTKEYTEEVNGVILSDPYRWLQDKESPAVRSYIDEENAYAEAVMSETGSLRQDIFEEIKARLDENETSAPVKDRGWLYYHRYEEGKSYPIYCRKKSADAEEEVILDQNELAEGEDFCSISQMRISPDGSKMLYGADFAGDEYFEIISVDLNTGEEYGEIIGKTTGDFEWDADGKGFFYTVPDDTRRPYSLFYHREGTDPERDVRLYSEDDCEYGLYIARAKSGKYLFVILGANDSSHSGIIPLGDPEADIRFLSYKRKGIDTTVYHACGRFFMRTNEDAENFKIMYAEDNEALEWKELIAHNENILIDDFEPFDSFAALKIRENGELKARVFTYDFEFDSVIDIPAKYGSLDFTGNKSSDAGFLRFSCQSNINPPAVYEWDFGTKSLSKTWEKKVNGYDPSLYSCERIFAPSHDGKQIPMTIVYRKDAFKKGESPCFLMGYGAYGYSYDPSFSSAWISMLDRGFLCATAHIRGGEEMGRKWYLDGKLLNKKNTFLDFISCAEYVKKSGLAGKTAVYGRSAGGLLIGAVYTMRPDAFDMAAAEVPFVDALNTMLDESLPLTVGEFNEWGNPRDPKYFEYIRSYSPYDNIKATEYPPLYMYSALNDTRVMYWEPLKFMAKLRKTRTDSNVSILSLAKTCGHFGASGRYDGIMEKAQLFAFVISTIGRK